MLEQDTTHDTQQPAYTEDVTSEENRGDQNSYSFSEKEETPTSLEELKKLASQAYTSSPTSTAHFLSEQLGMEIDTGKSLEQRIRSHQKAQTEAMNNYLSYRSTTPHLKDYFLAMLGGWDSSINTLRDPQNTLPSFLLKEHQKSTSGGFFIKWNGTGIVVNPGYQFLQNFHKLGFHIRDINLVIITDTNPATYADLKTIYDINYRLNSSSETLHTIEYYLNQQAYRNLATILKPNFKQERNTLHSLELYVDSPDMEVTELAEGISLRYFPSSLDSTTTTTSSTNLGLRFELENTSSTANWGQHQTLSIGYVSHTKWSSIIAQHLSNSDLIISGFGTTSPDDYEKVKYQEESLGFFGTYSILKEISPKIVITTDFDTNTSGDIRLESTRKMRAEFSYESKSDSTLLPGDTGLTLELTTLRVCCSVSKTLIEPSQVRIVKTEDNFGKLHYLSSNCFV